MSERKFQHLCPFVDAVIDETCNQILECRCFDSPDFLAAQDAMAVQLDYMRTGEQ